MADQQLLRSPGLLEMIARPLGDHPAPLARSLDPDEVLQALGTDARLRPSGFQIHPPSTVGSSPVIARPPFRPFPSDVPQPPSEISPASQLSGEDILLPSSSPKRFQVRPPMESLASKFFPQSTDEFPKALGSNALLQPSVGSQARAKLSIGSQVDLQSKILWPPPASLGLRWPPSKTPR